MCDATALAVLLRKHHGYCPVYLRTEQQATLGGLRTRPSGEVLRPSGEAVPGLYAAGRNCCGLPRWGEGYSSGMSLGDCTFFGRLAGRSAAAAPRSTVAASRRER